MIWADRLSTRRGSYSLLLVAMVLYIGLRVVVLAAPSVLAIMATRALAGFAFSFYTVAVVRFISEETTSHETRTVLALFNITLTNLVSIVSSPLAGAAYDHFGGRPLYLIAAVGYFLAWGGLYLARPQWRKTQPITES
jgi:MFS family permease